MQYWAYGQTTAVAHAAGRASCTPTRHTIVAAAGGDCLARSIAPRIARRSVESSRHLGRHRWIVDLNAQLWVWLDTVANVRLHGTTQRIVSEASAAERPELQPLPSMPFDALLKLERRVSNDGFVSIGGNYYSVPDRIRRVVEVHPLPDMIRILDSGRLVATHLILGAGVSIVSI